ncbi:Fusaric acid cluster transcription factor FUB10 like protein [Verticillium longisporum]|nr:Fusaric acid cluster transcription factor FUB10 like protein [Verticillium longisporum]
MSQSPPTKSKAMSRSKPESTSGIVKHRACDECRTRKLACSKEPDGCSRCCKEGIICVYSAQKPMGRPRKRRHVEDAEEQPSTTQSEIPSLQDSLRPSSHVQPDSLPVSSDLDLDFASFYHGDNDYLVNTDMSTMDFFDTVGGIPSVAPDFASFAMPYSEPQLAASGLQFGGVDLYYY